MNSSSDGRSAATGNVGTAWIEWINSRRIAEALRQATEQDVHLDEALAALDDAMTRMRTEIIDRAR